MDVRYYEQEALELAANYNFESKNSGREDWEKDGFETYEAYEEYFVKLVGDLYDESRTAWKDIKRRWMWADKRLEIRDSDVNGVGSSPTRSRLPIVHHAIEEAVSCLVENLPRPSVASRQAAQDDFASGLTYFMQEAMDQNDFDLLMGKNIWNQKRLFLGVMKTTMDMGRTGPLGKQGRIVIKNVDPRYVWFDPYARSYRWEDMRYLIVAEPYDLTDIRETYPGRGESVTPEQAYSDRRDGQDPEEDISGSSQWWSPMGRPDGGFVIGQRQRALVKELWLRDDSREFIPAQDDNGDVLYDSNGEPIGEWVRRYPAGRCLIVAGQTLLADFANPYHHKQPPYVFFPSRLASRLMAHSDLEVLCRIEDKINVIHTDLLKNARVNMNAPWVTDTKTFPSRELYKKLTSTPGEVIITNPGTRLERLPPGEIPSFVLPLLDWLQEMFDDVLGIQAIMRGQLQKGSQVSAATVDALQGTATSRMRLKARLLEQGLRDLGFQMHWLIRQFYGPGPGEPAQTFNIIDPATQKQIPIQWDPDNANGDYSIQIQSGSSLPGAKQGAAQQALVLYQNNLIDRKAALAIIGIPNAAAIDKRMADIEAAIFEAELTAGKSRKGPGRPREKMDGQPGRKPGLTSPDMQL